ncbi:MAG: hypothetical protein U5L06_12385 [Rhodovibrio sp.]|nr:hypothetical protein [Rhodovibrio sp.]
MTIIRKTLEQLEAEGGGYVDRARLDAMTDDDIARQIADDPDAAPEITEADLKRARLVKPYRSTERA